MRYRDLTEAPIANFDFIDKSQDQHSDGMPVGNSFRDDDVRAMANPKWRAKLVQVFRNTPHPINLYAVNAKFLSVHNSVRKSKSDAVTTIIGEIDTWAGLYNAQDFQATFGFLPPQHESALNFVLVQNEGDERIPMTPWMAAHRIVHALLNEQSQRGHGDYRFIMDKAFRYARNMMSSLRDSLDVPQLGGMHLSTRDPELYAAISTMASARHHKIARSGEFIIELFTQYFITGDFTIDLSNLPDGKKVDEEDIRYYETWCKDSLKNGIAAAVGQLIVF